MSIVKAPLILGTHYSIDDLKSANEAAGQHYFEKGTMRFFRSKVYDTVLPCADGWLFITSEQDAYPGSPNIPAYTRPRKFSIRIMRTNAHVDTVGEFQAYGTKRAAEAAAKQIAKEGVSNVSH